MYPLSNVLGNTLSDSFSEGYHYSGEGSYSRLSILPCINNSGGGGDCHSSSGVGHLEAPTNIHMEYGADTSENYGSHTDEYPIDNVQLDIDQDDINKKYANINNNVWDCVTCGVGKATDGNQCTTSGCEGCRRPIKRRNTANKKERRRTQSINNAFTELRDCIPNVPADTKLSKIKTLRLATSYIAYLSEVLSGDDPLRTPAAFTADLSRRMNKGGDEKKKEIAAESSSRSMTSQSSSGTMTRADSRRGKGRTGWPQYVWAMELQQ